MLTASAVRFNNMTARPGSIRADCKRRERENGRFLGRGDEGTVDHDMQVVVRGVQDGRLFKVHLILAIWIPADYE